MLNNKVMLQTVDLTNLVNWSVRYLLDNTFSYNKNYKLVSIGDFLTRNDNLITIKDETDYKRVTVKINNNGVYLRNIETGKNIGTKKQFVVNSGQFILSRIDARNGAFGIIPDELEGAIVTNDFPTFIVNENEINTQFLVLITTTKRFIKFAQGCSSGTTNRQRIDIDLFLNVKIPLPSLEEQNRIVKNYNEKIAQAKQQKAKAKELEKDIENYLFDVLGIEKLVKKKKKKGINLVAFQETNRWDVPFLINSIPSLNSKFPIRKFSEVVDSFNESPKGNSLKINSKDFPEDDFIYIGMEHIEKESGRLLELNSVKGKEIRSQTVRVPKDYFLYGKLRPYLSKYWLNKKNLENIICSSEFFVFKISDDINRLFFRSILSSSFIQVQISDKTSGARMPRINEETFNHLQFPLPSLEIQNEIAEHISNLKGQIKDLQHQSKQNRELAIKEFEREIFN